MRDLSTVTMMDKAEAAIAALPPVELPLKHVFTPSLYGRQIFLPAGTVLTSRRHKTEHQFVLAQGHVQVLKESGNSFEIEGDFHAPYHGVTKAGTKRLLYAVTSCVWITFHSTELTDPDEIVEEITDMDNPLVDPENPRFQAWRSNHDLLEVN